MRIYLRPVTAEDGKLIIKWRNNPIVASHCFNRVQVTEESNRKFFENEVKTGHYVQYIVERIDDEYGVVSYPIATVYLKDIDRTNKRCELCVFTSDDEEWETESQTIAIKLLLKKAFMEYGMHKVYSFVFASFEDEKGLLVNAGFREECVLKKEALLADGTYGDAYRMVIFDTDWNE